MIAVVSSVVSSVAAVRSRAPGSAVMASRGDVSAPQVAGGAGNAQLASVP